MRGMEGNYIESDRNYFESQLHRCVSLAQEVRNLGLDPEENPEMEIINSQDDWIKKVTGINDLDLTKIKMQETSVETALSVIRNFIIGSYGLYPVDETTINQALRLGLALLTKTRNTAYIRFVRIVVHEDQRKNEYFEVALNEMHQYVSPGRIFIAFLMIEELRKICNYGRPPATVVDSLIESLQKRMKIRSSKKQIDAKIYEEIRYILEHINYVVTMEANPRKYEYSTERTYNIQQLINVLRRVFLDRVSKNVILINKLRKDEWSWLQHLSQYELGHRNHLNGVILSNPKKGGFVVRIGKAQNIDRNYIGIHPSVFEIFDDLLFEGCQVNVLLNNSKIRNCRVVGIDTLSPPLVKLNDGSTVRLFDPTKAKELTNDIEKIISFGDMLVDSTTVSGFLPTELSSACSDSLWIESLLNAIANKGVDYDEVLSLFKKVITESKLNNEEIEQTVKTCRQLHLPLHTSISYDWGDVTYDELTAMINSINSSLFTDQHRLQVGLTSILDKIGVEYRVSDKTLMISERDHVLLSSLFKSKTITHTEDKPIIEIVNDLSGVEAIRKNYAGLEVQIKKNKPKYVELHGVLPGYVTNMRNQITDIISFCKSPERVIARVRYCDECSRQTPYIKCPVCGSRTTQIFYCESCNRFSKFDYCNLCGKKTIKEGPLDCNWSEILSKAVAEIHVQPYVPLVGLKSNVRFSAVERLEKVILRQKHNIKSTIDGTTKLYSTFLPLRYFKPKQVFTNITLMNKLNYTSDVFGTNLTSEEQILLLKPQDVVISYRLADQLRRVADFVDEILTTLYKKEPFYKINALEDILGHLIVITAQGSDCGVLGRIVGFTQADACYTSPSLMKSIDKSNKDDVYAIMLLMDVLINFSEKLIPERISVPASPHYIEAYINSSTDLTMEQSSHSLEPNGESKFTNLKGEKRNGISNDLNSQFTIEPIIFSERLGFNQTDKDKTRVAALDIAKIQLHVIRKSTNLDQSIMTGLIKSYLIPNLKRQIERYGMLYICDNCGRRYRRPPLSNSCLYCDKQIKPLISLNNIEGLYEFISSVEKSMLSDENLIEELSLLKENIWILKYGRKQFTLLDF